MDDADLKIIKMLFKYSRIPYRELSARLNLSLNAVHKRVQNLLKMEIISKFTAKPSLIALRGFTVFIFGESSAQDLDENCRVLKDEFTTVIMIAGGKFTYVVGEIKRLEDLSEYTSGVIKQIKLQKPAIGIVSQPQILEDLDFSKSDLRVIKSLSENSRKSVIDIAEDLDLSPKTVRKIMKRLQNKDMVEYSIDWAPNIEGSVTAIFHIELKPGQEIKDEFIELLENYPNVTHCHTFSNLPDLILVGTWFESLKSMKEFEKNLQMRGYQNISLRVMYNGYYFNNWRKNVLEELKNEK